MWTNLIDQIKTALTPLGKLASSPSSGSITVTDSRATVERIGKIIDDENIKILRAVRIQVEVYSVTTNDNAENGIDWNVVFQRVANGNPDVRFSAISPATLVSALVGSFTSTVQGGPGGTRALAGSTSVISALAQFGRVATVTRTAVSAGNNQPATFAVTNQTGYIAATTPATATAGGTGGVPGLTPGTVTTGFLLNMIPSIVDSRRILLNFSVDISELSRLQNFTSGAGATAQTVQTPEVSSFQVLNRSPVALGETLVLNLFERTNNQYDRRGLTEGSATSFSGRGRRETVVMFLTPVLIYDQI